MPVTHVEADMVVEESARWWANCSAHDAMYLATAVLVGADSLVTADRRWAGVPDLPVALLLV